MHHELFLALLGVCGEVVVERTASKRENVTTFTFDELATPCLLSEGDRQVLLPLLHVGYCFRRLSKFAQPPLDTSRRDGSSIHPSLYVHSFRQSLSATLAVYAKHVASLEQEVLAKTDSNLFPFARLLVDFQGELELFPFLCRLVDHIERKKLRGKGVLEMLQSHDRSGYPRVQACVQSYLCNAHRVFFRQMMSWMTAAHVVDPYGEFFITSPSSSSEYAVDLARVPLRYFPSELAEDVMFIGNAIKILGNNSQHHQAICSCLHSLASHRTWSTQVVRDELAKLRVVIASALGTRVVVQGQFIQWLARVKAFYLLGHGDFVHAVIDQASPVFANAPTIRSEQELNHGVWSAFELDASSMSLRVPLQEFSFAFNQPHVLDDDPRVRCRGLVLLGSWNVQVAGLAAADSPLTCWFHHIQYISRSFRTSFSVVLVDPPPLNAPPSEVSLVLQSDGVHVAAASCPMDSSSNVIIPSTSPSLRLQFQFHSVQDGACHVTTRLFVYNDGRNDAPSLHDTCTHLKTAGSISVVVDYAADISGWRVHMNDRLCFEYSMNVLKQVDGLARRKGGMFVGLVLLPPITLVSWSCGRVAADEDPWQYVGLDMPVPWPVAPLLLTPATLVTYNHVFQLLFRLKRVQFALNRTWKLSRHHSQSCAILRHRVLFALSHVFVYFERDVVDVHFHECVAACAKSSDFDVVKKAHDTFVAQLVKRCYLYSATVMHAIDALIALGWDYCRHEPPHATRDATYLASTLRHLCAVLANTDAHPLVLVLDFNGFFTHG
ncbi:hypothetical protein H257_18759 [Aphanomyces astaci]|uniref:Spindle pole body component n=1 Tax=Aphanomyces astaci TaxID=112090 RepID=W4FC79_APHAT|nr:hypothetical protein H257_18759 [Aphanomyces astaci]ETV64333.1 hypothetical protein H257_18759 [Aphanomyces astaci]|eukprot:XP_009846182.1 hypothetical protein H257_18759 [Aphanomyces astaci]